MKVREFITYDHDIDVYDNVSDELAIAFCGPLELTKEGEQHFSDVLDYEIYSDGVNAAVDVDGEDGEWQKKLKRAIEFFYAAAGYCADEDYKLWFV